MSDYDVTPDPLDKAYVQAEAFLNDEEARAARRARVLAAASREAEIQTSRDRRTIWRLGGGLAAAAVGGLSVLLAMHMREASAPRPPPAPAPAPANHPAPNAPSMEASPLPAAKPTALAPPQPAKVEAETRPPAADANDLSAARPSSVVTTARRAPETMSEALPVPQSVEEPAQSRPVARAKPAAPAAMAAQAFSSAEKATAGSTSDQAARLVAAAASGRIGEVKALLERGVPVDAIDADGETALMKSIRADQPAVATLLHARGADLDRENRAGESARDMAAAKADPGLDKALGLAP